MRWSTCNLNVLRDADGEVEWAAVSGTGREARGCVGFVRNVVQYNLHLARLLHPPTPNLHRNAFNRFSSEILPLHLIKLDQVL
jgi:hypothetical protein